MRRPVAALLAVALALGVASIVPSLSGATPKAAQPYAPTKGIAVLIDNASRFTDAQAMSIANSMFPILVNRFHANAVSLDFPYWQSSSSSNVPKRGPMSPSPQRLAAITEVAHRYHLAVEWRPYLFEGDLTNNSRTSITPRTPAVWISNYSTYLQPYLIAASESGASSFSVALELTTLMPYLSSWTTLIERAKTLFSGRLFYSQQHQPMLSLPLVDHGYDAYQPINSAPTITGFTLGFMHNFQLTGMQQTPADLTIEELGIAAVARANSRPFYEHYSPRTRVDRPLQEAWFQGACNAFWALHLQGLYFWAIGFGNWSPTENNARNHYAWYDTPTQNVVASCYARSS